MFKESAITVSDLSVSIGQADILTGISFSVRPKERVGIIGPNGSGKTTLFNTISGFVPASEGSISLFGRDVTKLSPSKRATFGVGRVFQNFGIFREMTLLENILTAIEAKQSPVLLPWGARVRANKILAREYLDQVRLADKAHERAGSLSGGQMRLLEIIRALAFGAEVFLLDEPTAGVSPKMKDDILEVLGQLESLGKTLLIIEHDINFIQNLCERIIVLDVGKVVLDDTAEKVRADARLQEIYFGSYEQAPRPKPTLVRSN